MRLQVASFFLPVLAAPKDPPAEEPVSLRKPTMTKVTARPGGGRLSEVEAKSTPGSKVVESEFA